MEADVSTISFSETLKIITSRITMLTKNGQKVLTAEKLFASALSLMENEDFLRENKNELSTLIRLQEKGLAPEDMKERLLSYISEKQNGLAIADNLYMLKMLNGAKAEAVKSGSPILTTDMLFSYLLENPSPSLLQCIYGNDRDRQESEDVSDTDLNLDFDFDFDIFDNEEDDTPAKKEEKTLSPAEARESMTLLTNKVRDTRNYLMNFIYGQDNAIGVFTTGYFQAELLSLTDKERTRPRASFLFAGPPGVGKTFMAEKAAAALKLPFRRFDMSEYASPDSTVDFCGMSSMWKDSKSGIVTSFVEENPQCLLLFDEVEKAHMNVIHLFLQILDAGRLKDNYTEKEVSFTDAIIILTTNAGKQLYNTSQTGDFSNLSRKVILKSLQRDVNPINGMPFFPAAICSRFASGNVIMFNHIAAHDLIEIAKQEMLRHAHNLENTVGIKLNIDERVFTSILFAEGGAADARTIRGRAENFFDSEIFELFRLVSSETVKAEISGIETINIGVELPNENNEILSLFESKDKHNVLLFASPQTEALCKSTANECNFFCVQHIADADEIMKKNDVSIIIADLGFGKKEKSRFLNIEDARSSGRDFLHYICEKQTEIPVYLLQTDTLSFNAEERFSFMRQGVRGIISLYKDEQDDFAQQLESICLRLHQQSSMISLAKSNKVVTFETGQTLSADGKQADITLFDFKMGVAVDAEDSENILSSISKPNVKFEQVIGADDAIKELKYFVEYLKNPKKFLGTGVKAPRGILLYGPPGTGKTMLAKAMASESDVTFITAEGNQFLKKYVGEGPAKVHELFKTARKYAPAILFVDEIDAIAKERTGSEFTNASEEILTSFLTEMDGFNSDPAKPVFVLAATNFNAEGHGGRSLDPALVRRFDRKVYIDLPGRNDRMKYMRMKIAENSALCLSEEKLENIAVRSTGRSLAELESVFELALRSAIRDGGLKVTDEVFEEAFETYFSGESKKWDVSQLERVARHEAGHAFLCWQSGEIPSYVTITARANHGGYMQHDDNEGKAIFTKEELLAKIRTSLGGRAAEIVYYGEQDGISTGASGDLSSATDMAYQMICSYGMDEEFGLTAINQRMAESGEMSVRINPQAGKILAEQLEKAVELIKENKASIDALVNELFSKNHLSGKEIDAIFSACAKERAK